MNGNDVQNKARDLFAVCDPDGKGFIAAEDMLRLRSVLPQFTPDDLEAIFDSLDIDGNGKLTLDEFIKGFGGFLEETGSDNDDAEEGGIEFVDDTFSQQLHQQAPLISAAPPRSRFDRAPVQSQPTIEDDGSFDDILEETGAHDLFDENSLGTMKNVWKRLRRQSSLGPSREFEQFLARVSNERREQFEQKNNLEESLRMKSYEYEDQLEKIAGEVETQLKKYENERLAEEKQREREIKIHMEEEIREKDRQLQEMLRKQQEMEERMTELNSVKSSATLENERLLKEKFALENKMSEFQEHLEESRGYIDSLQRKQKEERKRRAIQTLNVASDLASERDSLVKQLELLKEMNRKLRDEQDEQKFLTSPVSPGSSLFDELAKSSSPVQTVPPQRRLERDGSILSKYFSNEHQPPTSGNSTQQSVSPLTSDIDDVEYDDDIMTQSRDKSEQKTDSETAVGGSRQPENFWDPTSHPLAASTPLPSNNNSLDTRRSDGSLDEASKMSSFTVHSLENEQPERFFKVVFVGDSGVGKSSFIHRFCKKKFKSTFSATIGVDFQVKNIRVDGHIIALQLWDTAGQERFRSVTKQYFRKADGVVIMFDITSELSFTNVRSWMQSVEESADTNTVVMLLGNKSDLIDESSRRVITSSHGVALATETSSLFEEVSAKSGNNVQNAMIALSRQLLLKEDEEMENAVNLTQATPEKKCCGS